MKRYRIFLTVKQTTETFDGVYYETDDLTDAIGAFEHLQEMILCYPTIRKLRKHKYSNAVFAHGISIQLIDTIDLEFNNKHIYDVGNRLPLCTLTIDHKSGRIEDDVIYAGDIAVGNYDYSIPTIDAILNYLG